MNKKNQLNTILLSTKFKLITVIYFIMLYHSFMFAQQNKNQSDNLRVLQKIDSLLVAKKIGFHKSRVLKESQRFMDSANCPILIHHI